MTKAIYFGRRAGVYPQFSNFYESDITVEGIQYRNVEQAFQAAKTLDLNERKCFYTLSGSQAKAKGRRVCLRSDWERVKLNVMLDRVRAKYTQNEHLKNLLIGTGDCVILENTTGWKDNTWGCDFNTKPIGRNWLGLCIMKVRSELTGNPFVSIPSPDGDIQLNIVDNFDKLAYDQEAYKAMGLLYNWIYNTGNYYR